MRISKSFEIRTLFSSYFTESVELPTGCADNNLDAARTLIDVIKSHNCQKERGLKNRILYRMMWGTKNGPLGLVEKSLQSSTF